jgi:hypothetical protein
MELMIAVAVLAVGILLERDRLADVRVDVDRER